MSVHHGMIQASMLSARAHKRITITLHFGQAVPVSLALIQLVAFCLLLLISL